MVIELALSSAQLPLRHSVVHPRFGKGVEGVHNAHVSGLKLGCDYLDRWDHSESEGGHRGSPFFLVLRDGSRVTGGDWVATRRMRFLSARIIDPCRQCAHRRV